MSNNETRLSNEDLILWTKYISTKQIPEGATRDQIKRLARRTINLGDASAIATFIAKAETATYADQISMLLQKISVLEYVVQKELKLSEEDLNKYETSYQEEMQELLQDVFAELGEE